MDSTTLAAPPSFSRLRAATLNSPRSTRPLLLAGKCAAHNPTPPPLRTSLLRPISPASQLAAVAVTSFGVAEQPQFKLQHIVSEFQSLSEPVDRVKRLLDYAALLEPLPDADRVAENRVMGCTAQVWVAVRMDAGGRMRFLADSDSEITKGFCSCLIGILDGASSDEVLAMRPDDLGPLNVGLPGRANSRVNTWLNVLTSMQKRTNSILTERDGKSSPDPFPSLTISSDGIQAKGTYAKAQYRSKTL